MYRYCIIAIAAILFNINTSSANTRDSIGVENQNGKKVVIHKVVAKDTYYSIARRYNVNPKDVMNFNDSKYLQIGVIVKVPTSMPYTVNYSTATVKNTPGNTTAVPPAADSNSTEQGLIEHAVQKKENLNMLAEKYGTTVNEIKRINNLRSINLQIGQILKIPVKAEEKAPEDTATASVQKVNPAVVQPAVVQTTVQQPSQKQPVPAPVPDRREINKNIDLNQKMAENKPDSNELIVHTVASNETIYSIATKYKMTIDQLKAKNDMTTSSLNVGQKLLIKGQYPVKPANAPFASEADSLRSIKDPSLRYPAARYGLNQIEEKGTAVWIADADLDPTKMLVLHRTAPIGGIVKITNPMSNRSTFAKVVGKFTENESTKDVIIVMTKAVADALGALDRRFYCNLTYGGQENEQK
ncbi:MAG TPA: LysM peptidoglycan-binding domain-containing protein [Pedobacter sp.]|uniref:LysM peptidoglycan-binding domain-containing protein n=1 Tax=Pedobacter sp. TaxID=1411316 RepID=UPI002CD4572D|nr:LysM peptidoglycan-binding domain-containing protein [Pedobacter sp.]HMI01462.1 LysM peptidoglycan-binding domain-containing protein [Pedobacter sp.]